MSFANQKSEPIIGDKGMIQFHLGKLCLSTEADTWLNQRRLFLDTLVIASILWRIQILQKWCLWEWGMVGLIGESGFISRLLSSCSTLEIMRFVKITVNTCLSIKPPHSLAWFHKQLGLLWRLNIVNVLILGHLYLIQTIWHVCVPPLCVTWWKAGSEFWVPASCTSPYHEVNSHFLSKSHKCYKDFHFPLRGQDFLFLCDLRSPCSWYFEGSVEKTTRPWIHPLAPTTPQIPRHSQLFILALWIEMITIKQAKIDT